MNKKNVPNVTSEETSDVSPHSQQSMELPAEPILKRTGLNRILHAFKFSYRGFCYIWKTQEAFRQECVVLSILTSMAFFIILNPSHLAAIVISHLSILLVEVINTAVEVTIDRIGLEYHALSAAAKDLGSAAVLLSFLMSACVWCAALFLRASGS